jgi:hypothetical protein
MEIEIIIKFHLMFETFVFRPMQPEWNSQRTDRISKGRQKCRLQCRHRRFYGRCERSGSKRHFAETEI